MEQTLRFKYIRGTLSFGSYLKILGLIGVGYGILNEVYFLGRYLWLHYSGTLPPAPDSFPITKYLALFLGAPIQAFISLFVGGLLGYPLYWMVCKRRNGLNMQGSFGDTTELSDETISKSNTEVK